MKKINRRSVYQTERVIFLKPIDILDEHEETHKHWEEVETLWARVFPLKMEESLHYYLFFEGKDTEWLSPIKAVRWNNKILDIISSMRWCTRNGSWIDLLTREQNG